MASYNTMESMQKRLEAIRGELERYGQDHLLTYWPSLSASERARLLEQLKGQDWAELHRLIGEHVIERKTVELPDPSRIEPVPYYPFTPPEGQRETYAHAREVGLELLRQGRVAAFTVAGGQGTRLGWDGPKGTFPATPIRRKPLFQVFAEYLLKVGQKYGKPVPWYVMTSPHNHHETCTFFERYEYFGLAQGDVTFFQQGTMPSIDASGKVLLADRGELALNPDGHGGSLRALVRSGALDDMERRGVEQISYFQVDNPHVSCVDPLFVGLHVLEEADMSSKMLPKAAPDEKVGNLCLIDGRTSVIEYSDLPRELAEARTASGALKFNAGSIAIHVLAVDFVRKLDEEAKRGAGLPFHRADKKVPHLDVVTGERVEPDEPNAVKLEAFVFDALPFAARSVTLETDRVEEFAPIKNAEGVDSPASSMQLQSLRAGRWLERRGVRVPFRDSQVDAVIELSHLTAIEPQDLEEVELPREIPAGAEVYF